MIAVSQTFLTGLKEISLLIKVVRSTNLVSEKNACFLESKNDKKFNATFNLVQNNEF